MADIVLGVGLVVALVLDGSVCAIAIWLMHDSWNIGDWAGVRRNAAVLLCLIAVTGWTVPQILGVM